MQLLFGNSRGRKNFAQLKKSVIIIYLFIYLIPVTVVLQAELIYYVFGRHKFPGATTANLEQFVRHFNKVQYWVVTELCLCEDVMKRSILLKKFIKIAIM